MNKNFGKSISILLATIIVLGYGLNVAQVAKADPSWGSRALAYISGSWSGLNDSGTEPTATPSATTSGLQLLNSNTLIATQSPSTGKTIKPSKPTTYVVPATAYSSTADQTDASPFITASGTHVRDGVAAANFLPIGTVFRIPELYGDKTFVIEDRMNARYTYRLDIWFASREAAKQFGVRTIKIEIVS